MYTLFRKSFDYFFVFSGPSLLMKKKTLFLRRRKVVVLSPLIFVRSCFQRNVDWKREVDSSSLPLLFLQRVEFEWNKIKDIFFI